MSMNLKEESSDVPINPRIIEIVKELDSQFWDSYEELCSSFPDTEEGDEGRHLSLISSIASIVSNYILGFQPSFRASYLENLVQKLRFFETQFRDYKLPDNTD